MTALTPVGIVYPDGRIGPSNPDNHTFDQQAYQEELHLELAGTRGTHMHIHTYTPSSLSRIHTRIHSLSLARALSFFLALSPFLPLSLSLSLSLPLPLPLPLSLTRTCGSQGGDTSAPAVNGCGLQSQIRNVGCASRAGV